MKLIAVVLLSATWFVANGEASAPPPAGESQSKSPPAAIPAEYDAVVVQGLLTRAQSQGNPSRGVMVFGSEKFTCISCHKIGDQPVADLRQAIRGEA